MQKTIENKLENKSKVEQYKMNLQKMKLQN